MNEFVTFFCQSVDLFLQAIMLLYLLRCILNFFAADESSPLMFFAVTMTEVFILPVRMLFDKLGWSDDMIIDIPGLLAMFILSVVDAVLL